MATILNRRQIIAFLGGFLMAALLATSLSLWGVLPHASTHAARAASGPANYLSSNPNAASSEALYAAQYYLHDHYAQTLKAEQQAKPGAPHRYVAGPLFMAPGGALSFNSDTSVATQNDESFAIDPTTTSAQAGMVGVGGFTDYRAQNLCCNLYTGDGYAVSKNVGCTAGTCATLLKDGWIPGATDPNCTDGSVLEPFGDPSVAVSASGTFYYAALAEPASGSCAVSNNDSGIIIATSNANLENPSSPCADAFTSNNCWTSTIVHETSSTGCSSNPPVAPCAFDDKEWITVDPASGGLTVAWDVQDDVINGVYVETETCTAALVCGAPSKVSVPPAGCTPQTSPNPYDPCDNTYAPYLAIWHNPGSGVNNVVMTYVQKNNWCPVSGPCDFNTDLHLADLTTHSDQIFLSLPQNQGVLGLSGTQFRIQTQVKIAADYRSVATPHLYVTWEECKSVGANYYYGQACAQSVVHVQDFTSPTGTGTGISVLGGFNQFFPSLAVDEAGATAGHVALSYYSTQGDGTGASALIRPYAAFSTGGASPTAFSANTYQSVLTANFRYTADPYFATFFFGSQMGDYQQVAAANGAIFIHFNGTYEQKAGPPQLGTVAVNQSDNYLCYIQPTTLITASGACSSQ